MEETENWFLAGIFATFIGLLALVAFSGYKYGAVRERQALTSALKSQIEGVYSEGLRDGHKNGTKECDDIIEEMNSHGRY